MMSPQGLGAMTCPESPVLWWCQNADRQWREGREEKARLEAKADTLLKLKREQELKLKYASRSNLL